MKQCLLTRDGDSYGVILTLTDKMAKVGKHISVSIETHRGKQTVVYVVHAVYTIKL